MQFINYSFAIAIIFCGLLALASEKNEGGGDSSNNGGASSEQGFVKGADREWAQRKTKLNIYESKIKDYTKDIQHLIHLKNTNTSALDEKGKPINVLDAIATTHKKLKTEVDGYNKEKEELKYRFPEEGRVIERRYVPLRAQSLEEIEKEMGLDWELTQTKKKIDKKYSTFIGYEDVKPISQKPKGPEPTLYEKKSDEETPTRLKLSK
ncbi:MAG: hypothetical protein A2Z20_04315 [Bdellovibrionales bacterium RBG_16_40_8]|nr:MAG: hypothetical protein A2Z20_04315 [Bdellovibrionales bacterium RBG_16_40_8]